MSGDNIKVAIRVRPLIKREQENNAKICWEIRQNTIRSIEPTDSRCDDPYTFDHIFGMDSTNKDLYDDVVAPLVSACVDGYHCTIFTYGQTSSGKTYTLDGSQKDPGIISRVVDELFKIIEKRKQSKFLIRVSYFEIYNEKIYDLFKKEKNDVKIREDFQGNINVSVEELVTSSKQQLMQLMFVGKKNRSVHSTRMNIKSSRSHTIFRIIVECTEGGADGIDQPVKVSHFNLVDLAGSERVRDTRATGQRLVEGAAINRSLLTLTLVISQLAADQNKFINFRDSKLTLILRNVLGGNSKTLIVANITPASLDDTHSTLCFAKRAKTIKNQPVINTTGTSLLGQCQAQINKLQSELKTVIEHNKDLASDNADAKKTIKELQERIKLNYQAFAKQETVRVVPPSRRRHTIGEAKNISVAEEFQHILRKDWNDPATGIPLTHFEVRLLDVLRTNAQDQCETQSDIINVRSAEAQQSPQLSLPNFSFYESNSDNESDEELREFVANEECISAAETDEEREYEHIKLRAQFNESLCRYAQQVSLNKVLEQNNNDLAKEIIKLRGLQRKEHENFQATINELNVKIKESSTSNKYENLKNKYDSLLIDVDKKDMEYFQLMKDKKLLEDKVRDLNNILKQKTISTPFETHTVVKKTINEAVINEDHRLEIISLNQKLVDQEEILNQLTNKHKLREQELLCRLAEKATPKKQISIGKIVPETISPSEICDSPVKDQRDIRKKGDRVELFNLSSISEGDENMDTSNCNIQGTTKTNLSATKLDEESLLVLEDNLMVLLSNGDIESEINSSDHILLRLLNSPRNTVDKYNKKYCSLQELMALDLTDPLKFRRTAENLSTLLYTEFKDTENELEQVQIYSRGLKCLLSKIHDYKTNKNGDDLAKSQLQEQEINKLNTLNSDLKKEISKYELQILELTKNLRSASSNLEEAEDRLLETLEELSRAEKRLECLERELRSCKTSKDFNEKYLQYKLKDINNNKNLLRSKSLSSIQRKQKLSNSSFSSLHNIALCAHEPSFREIITDLTNLKHLLLENDLSHNVKNEAFKELKQKFESEQKQRLKLEEDLKINQETSDVLRREYSISIQNSIAKNEFEKLQEKFKSEQNERNKLSEKLEVNREKYDFLKKENQSMRATFLDLQHVKSQLENSLKEQQSINIQHQKECTILHQKSCPDCNTINTQATEEINKHKANCIQAEEQNKFLMERVQQLQKNDEKYDFLKEENRSMLATIQHLQFTKFEFENLFKEQQLMNVQLQEECTVLRQKSCPDCNTIKTQATEEINKHKANYIQAEEQNKFLLERVQQLQKNDEKYVFLKEENRFMRETIQNLQHTKFELENLFQEQQLMNVQLQEECTVLRQRSCSDCDTIKAEAKEEINMHIANYTQAREQNKFLMDRIQQFNEKYEFLKEENQAMHATIQNLQHTKFELENLFKEQQLINVETKEEINKHIENYTQAREQNKILMARVQQFSEKYEFLKEENQAMHATIQNLQLTKFELENLFKEQQLINVETKEEINKHVANYTQAREQNKFLMERLQQLQKNDEKYDFLKEENRSMRATIQNLQLTKFELENSLKEQQSMNAQLQKECTILQEKSCPDCNSVKVEAREEINKHKANYTQAREQNNFLMERVRQLEKNDEAEKLRIERHKLNEELKANCEKYNFLKRENQSMRATIQNLQHTNFELENSLKDQQSMNVQLQKQCTILQEKSCPDCNSVKVEAREEINKHKANYTQAREQNNFLMERVRQLEKNDEAEKLRIERHKLNEELKVNCEKYNFLKRENQSMRATIQNLQHTKFELENSLKDQQSMNVQLQKECTILQKKSCPDCNSVKVEAREEINKHKANYTQTREQNNFLMERVRQLEKNDEAEKLRIERHKLNEELKANCEKYNFLKRENQSMRATIQDLEHIKSELENSLKEQQSKNVELQKECTTLHQKSSPDDCTTLKAEAVLRIQLSEVESKLNATNMELRRLRSRCVCEGLGSSTSSAASWKTKRNNIQDSQRDIECSHCKDYCERIKNLEKKILHMECLQSLPQEPSAFDMCYQARAEAQSQEIRELLAENKKLKEECKKLQIEQNMLIQERDKLKEKIDSTGINLEMQKQMSKLKQQISEVSTKYEQAKAIARRRANEIAELQAQLRKA